MFSRASPRELLQAKAYIWPYIPPLVLIRIQYHQQHGDNGSEIEQEIDNKDEDEITCRSCGTRREDMKEATEWETVSHSLGKVEKWGKWLSLPIVSPVNDPVSDGYNLAWHQGEEHGQEQQAQGQGLGVGGWLGSTGTWTRFYGWK